MGIQSAEKRTLVIKAGMTPKDVINSKEATAQQKKMAYVFDSDGVEGYSQKEADVFNATVITDRGSKGISLWTRYADDSIKETKFQGDIASFKFAPKGDVKPYTVSKKQQNIQQKQNKNESMEFDNYYKEALKNVNITSKELRELEAIYGKRAFVSEIAKKEFAKVYYASGRALNDVIDATGAYYNKVVDRTGAHYNKVIDETGQKVNNSKTNEERDEAIDEMNKKREEAHSYMVSERTNAQLVLGEKRDSAYSKMAEVREKAEQMYIIPYEKRM